MTTLNDAQQSLDYVVYSSVCYLYSLFVLLLHLNWNFWMRVQFCSSFLEKRREGRQSKQITVQKVSRVSRSEMKKYTGNWKIVTFSLHPGTQQQQRRNRSSAASAPQNFDDIYVLDNKITSSCRAKWNSQGQAHSRRAGSIILNQIINLLLNITLWNDTKTHFVFFKHQQRCMLTSPGLWTQYHLLWALPWIKIVWLRC